MKEKVTRIRRTKAEVESGMTQEEKRAQVLGLKTTKAKAKSKSSKSKKTPKKEVTKTQVKVSTKKPEVVEVEKEVIIKEVRILNGTTGTKQTVKELLDEELGKCSWEWKYIPMDKDFKVSMLNTLGKQGWKFAFIHEPGVVNERAKNKPNVICMQRAKYGKS